MLKRIVYIVLFLISVKGISQDLIKTDTLKNSTIAVTLKGQVVDQLDKTP